MNNFYVVDRIENDVAVIECPDKSFINVSFSLLPKSTKEGSVLIKSDDGAFIVNEKEEKKRKNENLKLQNSIFTSK